MWLSRTYIKSEEGYNITLSRRSGRQSDAAAHVRIRSWKDAEYIS